MATNYTPGEIDEFVQHYLAAALWSSHDYRSEPDSPDFDEEAGENMDDSYSWDDALPSTLVDARADVLDFVRQCDEAGIDLRALGGNEQWPSVAQHGHDLWLTRNGHGAGFWDRGYGLVGDQLADIARHMGGRGCSAYGSFYIVE